MTVEQHGSWCPCYRLIAASEPSPQHESVKSFIGGRPVLPADIELPCCGNCGAVLSFFFQVAFPKDHYWSGRSLAVFECTLCDPPAAKLPALLPKEIDGREIPLGFFSSYQSNFRFLVFPTRLGEVRTDYPVRVVYCKLLLRRAVNPGGQGNKVGGLPYWLVSDQSPATYAEKTKMVFLMQIRNRYEFHIPADASPQKVFENPKLPNDPCYYLFFGNQSYYFGTISDSDPMVYVALQK